MVQQPLAKSMRSPPRPKEPEISARVMAIEASMSDMHAMVTEMYQSLMVPQPGQGASLLNRTAKVVIDIESGERTSDRAINMAQKLITLGSLGKTFALWVAFGVAVYTALRLGVTTKGNGP